MKVYVVHGKGGDGFEYMTWINSIHNSVESAMWYIKDIKSHYYGEYPRLVELNRLERIRILTEEERKELNTLENRWYFHDDDANYWIEEYDVLE